MATYLTLNILVMISALVALRVVTGSIVWNRNVVITLLVLLTCTAVFDSVIIAAGIVDYNESLILGFRIGSAPVEDFFYSILAALLVPSIWKFLRKDKNNAGD